VVWTKNHWDGLLRFGLKTGSHGFSGLASKPVVTISPSLASKPVAWVSWFEPQNRWLGFPSLGLKTSSYGLVICASKLLRRFLGLTLKSKQATVCRLCHKTNGRATAWDMRWDLAACFTWKQVGIGFPNLASKLAEARRRVVHVAPSRRLHRVEAGDRLVDATGCIRLYYPYFTVFYVLGSKGSLVFCLAYK
jgi:hypothetical protein